MTQPRDTDEPPASLRALIDAWEARDDRARRDAGTYLAFARHAITFGHPTLAYDILGEGMERYPENPDIVYTAALALARAGSIRGSEALVERVLAETGAEHPVRVEALDLGGRLAKDCWARLPEGPERERAGHRSCRLYGEAFRISGDYFPGINAATMAALTGDAETGRDLARGVLCICEREDPDDPDFWLPATKAEAHLLLGRHDEAALDYARAARLAKRHPGHIASMRRQVRLLAASLEVPDAVRDALALPVVVAVTGHMIDAPDRPEPRFPPALEAPVRAAVAAALERLDAGFGYGSAAAGTDILFAEEMAARGAEVNVILPFRRSDFVETSVRHAGAGWVARLDRVLSTADTVSLAATEGYLGDDVLFTYTADLVRGEAHLRAARLETRPVLLAVVDAAGAELPGGSREAVRTWREAGGAVETVDLDALRRAAAAGGPSPGPTLAWKPVNADPPPGLEGAWGRRRLATMLFADVVGFSKLSEEAAPAFFVDFLGEVAGVIAASARPPVFRNTWGDGLFLAFDEVTDAADFALRLRDRVRETDWAARGLPAETSIRVGMHTGPVFPADDPILGRRNFFGSHVNLAARIEPVAAPGAVCVSARTAAILAGRSGHGFACDYLGTWALAKGFGESALYRLRRAPEVE